MKVLCGIADGTFPSGMPNGIDGRTICALARYAGISDRISILGCFDLSNTTIFHKLLAQIIWYFVEGIHCRFDEYQQQQAKVLSATTYKCLIES